MIRVSRALLAIALAVTAALAVAVTMFLTPTVEAGPIQPVPVVTVEAPPVNPGKILVPGEVAFPGGRIGKIQQGGDFDGCLWIDYAESSGTQGDVADSPSGHDGEWYCP